MSKPLWPAMSGAIARDYEVEVIANNLANANTNGFKKDNVVFKEYLAQPERESPMTADIPRLPIKDKDLYPLDGKDQSFVVVNGTVSSHAQGGLKVTDNPLDVALNGPGFFEVSTPSGIRYTRSGSFKLAPDGRLVTSDGFPVLSQAEAEEGAPQSVPQDNPQILGQANNLSGRNPAGLNAAREPAVAARFIQLLGREGPVHINDGGEIYLGQDRVGKLSVVEFKNMNLIRKTGGVNFENKDPVKNSAIASESAVKQGMIETSNVNPVEEISNLIRANRMFEQDLKAMKTVNEMMQKEVNDIGKM